jgi:phage terminase large subunit-like protein
MARSLGNVTRGRTLDNTANLAQGFVAHVMDKYGGTQALFPSARREQEI